MDHKKNINLDTIKQWLDPEDASLAGATESALHNLAKSNAIEPSSQLKSSILSQIEKMNALRLQSQPLKIESIPLLNEYSHASDWARLVHHIVAPEYFEDIHLEPIRNDATAELFVAFVKKSVPEETHRDVLESFLLLEGSCTCEIIDAQQNKRIVHMEAGDYLSIDLDEKHSISITSDKPAKAILQWLKIAA